jgi:hypothetical protein
MIVETATTRNCCDFLGLASAAPLTEVVKGGRKGPIAAQRGRG